MRCSDSWQLVSRCRQNPETAVVCDSPQWDIRAGLQRLNCQWNIWSCVKLPADLKLCKTCHYCIRQLELWPTHVCKSQRFTIFICFAHKKTADFIMTPFNTSLIKISTDQFIHLSILWLNINHLCRLQFSYTAAIHFYTGRTSYWPIDQQAPEWFIPTHQIDSVTVVLVRQHRLNMIC